MVFFFTLSVRRKTWFLRVESFVAQEHIYPPLAGGMAPAGKEGVELLPPVRVEQTQAHLHKTAAHPDL